MTDQTNTDSILLSNGHAFSYTALDEMLEQKTLIEVARELSVTAGELIQVLKARPRT